MKLRTMLVLALAAIPLTGCAALDHLFCAPDCRSETHQSSSLVNFLYPNGKAPPREDPIPELRVPLRVALAFLPAQDGGASGLDAAHREELMARIHQRFADRKFIGSITEIPDYYLKANRGFEGLEGVQRLYNVDVMALISYDQVTHTDDNDWSLAYLTIVGAYAVKGSRHDISTLVDLAVIDPATHSLVLRAGGTDTRHGNTTLIEQQRETRTASAEGFAMATNQTIENFDVALKKLEADVKAGKANVRVVNRSAARVAGGGGGGGGAIDPFWLAALGLLGATLAIRRAT